VLLLLQLDAQMMALLIQNMDRLDEQIKEEADGVHNSLGIVISLFRGAIEEADGVQNSLSVIISFFMMY